MDKEELFLSYYSDYDSKKNKEEPILCKFKIKYSPEDREIKEAVQECIQWAGSFPNKIMINNHDEEFELRISGRGHDNRCTWCRSFRTRLRNLLANKGIKLGQRVACRFDKSEDYGSSHIEILKKRVALYNLGLGDESEEDIEMVRESLREMEGE